MLLTLSNTQLRTTLETLNSKTLLEKFQGVVEVPFYFGQPKFVKLSLKQKVANTIVALLASQSSALRRLASIEH